MTISHKVTRDIVFAHAMVAFALGTSLPAFGQSPSPTSPYRLNIGAEPFRLSAPDATSPSQAESPGTSDKPFAALINKAATEVSIDPALVHAVIHVESGYNPAARSPKGAVGLMQVMPDTASRYGVKDPGGSPQENLRAGTRYLKDLMQMFSNRLELVLAAYNAGEQAVLRYGERIPPFRETQNYVPAVLAKYREFRGPPEPVNAVKRSEYMPGTRLAQPSPEWLAASRP